MTKTRDLRDTGAMLYQLSYEATRWERGQFIELISPVRRVSERNLHGSISSPNKMESHQMQYFYFSFGTERLSLYVLWFYKFNQFLDSSVPICCKLPEKEIKNTGKRLFAFSSLIESIFSFNKTRTTGRWEKNVQFIYI